MNIKSNKNRRLSSIQRTWKCRAYVNNMLIKIFGSNSIFSLVILILLTAVLWSKMFFAENVFMGYMPVSPFYNFFVSNFSGMIIISSFITFSLVFFQALLMNNILVENDLLPKKTYLAAFLYVLFTASFSDIVLFHPFIFSGILLTFSLMYLLKLYGQSEGYSMVFNIATLVSLSSLFYFPSIVFIFFIWACFIVYRLFAWREWFISIIGLALPYLFLGTYYYWTDRLQLKMDEYLNAFQLINFHNFTPTLSAYIFIVFAGLLLLIAFFRLIKLIGEKAIRIRKLLSIMIWLFLISYVSMVLSPNYGIMGYVILLATASILISLYISNIRKPLRAEIILIVIVIVIAFNRLGILESVNKIF